MVSLRYFIAGYSCSSSFTVLAVGASTRCGARAELQQRHRRSLDRTLRSTSSITTDELAQSFCRSGLLLGPLDRRTHVCLPRGTIAFRTVVQRFRQGPPEQFATPRLMGR